MQKIINIEKQLLLTVHIKLYLEIMFQKIMTGGLKNLAKKVSGASIEHMILQKVNIQPALEILKMKKLQNINLEKYKQLNLNNVFTKYVIQEERAVLVLVH